MKGAPSLLSDFQSLRRSEVSVLGAQIQTIDCAIDCVLCLLDEGMTG